MVCELCLNKAVKEIGCREGCEGWPSLTPGTQPRAPGHGAGAGSMMGRETVHSAQGLASASHPPSLPAAPRLSCVLHLLLARPPQLVVTTTFKSPFPATKYSKVLSGPWEQAEGESQDLGRHLPQEGKVPLEASPGVSQGTGQKPQGSGRKLSSSRGAF